MSISKAVGDVHAIVGHSVGGTATLLATRLGVQASRPAFLAPPTSPAPFASFFAKTLDLDPQVERAMLARLEARYAMSMRDRDARLDAARLTSPHTRS